MILLNLANIVIAAHAKSEFQTTDSLRLFSCHEQTPGAALSSIDDLLCTGLKYDALSVLKVKSAKGAIDFSPGQANVRSVALGLWKKNKLAQLVCGLKSECKMRHISIICTDPDHFKNNLFMGKEIIKLFRNKILSHLNFNVPTEYASAYVNSIRLLHLFPVFN